MIRLFENNETSFTTNGLGTLEEATFCHIVEERNGEFELEMDYPITGKRYSYLELRRIIFAKSNPFSNGQAFRIYEISKPINGIVTVKAAHLSYDLSGYPVSAFTAKGAQAAFSAFKDACPVTCPFIFNTDKDLTNTFTLSKPSSMRSVLGGTEGSFLDIFRGEYVFDNYTVSLLKNRGLDRGVTIRYGKNLTDLTQEENCNNVYTAIYPFWYNATDGLVELSNKILSTGGTYDYTRVLSLDCTSEFTEKPTQAALLAYARNYISSNDLGVPKVSIDVSFVSLADADGDESLKYLEEIHLCDTVTVVFEKIGVSATAKCIKTEYDAITDKYTKISLGDAKSNLATTIANQATTINETAATVSSQLTYTIAKATETIVGGRGGYVVMRNSTSGSKQPDEILIMDTDSVTTAKKVWRWNKNGFGYSSNGVNGPYGTAITNDGKIVANYITSGTMSCDILKGGTINGQTIVSPTINTIGSNFYVTDAGFCHMEDVDITVKPVKSIQTVKGQNGFESCTVEYYVKGIFCTAVVTINVTTGYAGVSDDYFHIPATVTYTDDSGVSRTKSTVPVSILHQDILGNKYIEMSDWDKTGTYNLVHFYVSDRANAGYIYRAVFNYFLWTPVS